MVKISVQIQMERLQMDTRHTISARVALRAVPTLIHPSTAGKRRDDLVLIALRCVLLTVVTSRFSTSEFKSLIQDAQDNIRYRDEMQSAVPMLGRTSYLSYQAIKRIIASVISPQETANQLSLTDINLADAISNFVDPDTVLALSEADIKSKPNQILATPLWGHKHYPVWLEDALASYKCLFDESGSWSFWRRWHDGFIKGQPMDWELQRQVALIPNEEWDIGHEHIAKLIAEIETRQAAKGLEEYLSQTPIGNSAPLSPLIGHNNPPPDLDGLPVSQFEMQRLVQIVQIVQQQLQEPNPDAAALTKLTEEAEEIQEKSANWLAKGLGLSRDEFFKEFGKWGGRAAIAGLSGGALWLVGAMEKLYPMIQALWQLLRMMAS